MFPAPVKHLKWNITPYRRCMDKLCCINSGGL